MLVDLIVLIATTATGICRLARHAKIFGTAGQGLMAQFVMNMTNFLAFMGESRFGRESLSLPAAVINSGNETGNSSGGG